MHTSRTVYLIDDDASARQGLASFFAAAGYTVEAFSSTDNLTQTPSLDKHTCLVMDAWGKGSLGADLQILFAQKNVNIPVVVLSARDDQASRDIALAARADGFFRKPVDGPALLDAIEWALSRHDQGFSSRQII